MLNYCKNNQINQVVVKGCLVFWFYKIFFIQQSPAKIMQLVPKYVRM